MRRRLGSRTSGAGRAKAAESAQPRRADKESEIAEQPLLTIELRDSVERLETVSELVRETFRFAAAEIERTGLLTQADDPVHCVVGVDPDAVIPEIGMGAYTDDERRVSIELDPDNPALQRDFRTEFTAALAHECHHALRMRGPGYGESVGEAIVSEGLACHAETSFRDGAAPFYARGLATRELTAATARVRRHWNEADYRQAVWFFGADPEFLPKFAGYGVGFALVDAFVRRDGRTALDLVREPAVTFRPD